MDFIGELNEKQYEAVASCDKYLRIIAGAGSGKTRVLTYRIAYLLSERSFRPFEVLAITFTNKVAKEMKERTQNLLPEFDLKDLKISTFHSFCNYFLRREINALGFPKAFTIFDEDDKTRLVKEVCKERGIPKGADIIKESINYISNKKCDGKLPNDIEFTKDDHEKEMLEIFMGYEKKKNAQYSLDFDDLLIYTVLILKEFPEIKEKYNRRFKEVLVDEFQDTNALQFKLLTLLCGENTGIFVVGDPDQTIYTWRGAKQKLILDFNNYFVGAKTIILNENYRSTQNILNHSNELIAVNEERIKKDLFTNGEKGKEVQVLSFYNSEIEAREVIKRIKNLHEKSGVNYNQCAILYRSGYLSRLFEKELVKEKIPYRVYSGVKFYERKEIKDALAYFNLMINPLDNVSFDRIINVPRRKIGEKTLDLIKEEAKEHNLSYFNYVSEINSHITRIGTSTLLKLEEMLKEFDKCKDRLKEGYEMYSEVLQDFLQDIGYYDYLAEDEESGDDRIENVKSLIDDIRSYLKNNPESTFDEYLQNVTLFTSQDELDSEVPQVNLMTVHTAKGLEFDYVFIVGFMEGVFPNARSLLDGDSKKQLEEERRLAYVAFTRAKKELLITYNNDYSYTLAKQGEPSEFISQAGLVAKRDMEVTQKTSNSNIYSFSSTGTLRKVSSNDDILERKKDVPIFGESQGTSWKVGDELTHKAFGDGIVKEVHGDVIVVDFKNFGIKKMSGSHKFLTKK